jgi:hypothetical protein
MAATQLSPGFKQSAYFTASVACFLAAALCGALSLGGRLKFGDWHWPGWTIGGTFGFTPEAFDGLAGVQKIAAAVAPQSPGWIFFGLMFAFGWLSSIYQDAATRE